MNYLQHPLSAVFPPMLDDEYEALKDSILDIGVQNPITLHDGMVIDGWHRYTAAIELDMNCPTVVMGDVDPLDFVIAQNKARRNLTASQRAAAVTSAYTWHASHRTNKGAPGAPLLKTNDELAEIAGTSVRTIKQAKAVQSDGFPAVQDAVKAGLVSIKTAAAVARMPAKQQEALAAQGPDAMRAAAKPAKPAPVAEEVEPESQGPEDYTELDAAYEMLSDLRDELVVARMGNSTEEEQQQATLLIAELRAEVKTLDATLRAVTLSRDFYMDEKAQMMRQMAGQRNEINKLKNNQ